MKKNKLKRTILVLSSFIYLNSFAQPPAGEGPMGPPPEMSKSLESNEEKTICQLQNEWLNKKLKLGKDQIPQVEKVTAAYVKKRLALKTKEERKETIETDREQAELERDRSLKNILSEKQFSRYLKQKHILENSFDNAAYGGMPPPPGM